MRPWGPVGPVRPVEPVRPCGPVGPVSPTGPWGPMFPPPLFVERRKEPETWPVVVAVETTQRIVPAVRATELPVSAQVDAAVRVQVRRTAEVAAFWTWMTVVSFAAVRTWRFAAIAPVAGTTTV